MKLVHRVSVFFLISLAVVLVAYSAILYLFIRHQLYVQFEQTLDGALHSLVAAVEVEPEEVKWQPLEHSISVGSTSGPTAVEWVVIGDGHLIVEQSQNASPSLIAAALERASLRSEDPVSSSPELGTDWYVIDQRLVAPTPEREGREPDEFDEVLVVVAGSLQPLDAALHRIMVFIGVLPAAVWLIAAAFGHHFGRRALQPLTQIAEQTRAFAAGNFHARLPARKTDDELAELTDSFNDLLDRHQRAFEQLRRFAGDAAHELRTPLTVLLGQMDVSLRRPRSQEEYVSTLTLLRAQSAELKELVESLLFLARMEGEGDLPDGEDLRLEEWMPSYLARWDGHPRRIDIHLITDPPLVTQVRVAPPLLARLLDNLVENGLKYSTVGTPLTITVSQAAGMATVTVADQGQGIAPEDQAAIFNPFFRARAARDAGASGTGLGLAIALKIATAFSGSLSCVSRLGKGSRFTLHLPLSPSEPSA